MAILKIYSDIVDDESNAFLQLFGMDGVTFTSVDEFIDTMAAEDNEIRLKINCRGGLVDEAWAIYDALRASGKQISAEVIGEASSSATILLCAAARGSRSCHPNAKFLFHYPFINGIYTPVRSEDLENIARDLTEEETRLLDMYVERTGCDREEMDALMREDRKVDAETAKRLGFIDTIIAPRSASNIKSRKTHNKMSIKEAFATIGAAIGLSPKFALELETAEGGTLRLRKEYGEPRVGDEVDSPDGEYLMPDGATIVVEDGVIVEIRETAETTEIEVEDKKTETEGVGGDPLEETTEEKDKKIGDLEAEVERLHRDIAERDARIAELEAEVERLRGEQKTEADKTALNAVRAAGGIDALRKLTSKAEFDNREFEDKKAEDKPKKMSYREYYNSLHANN